MNHRVYPGGEIFEYLLGSLPDDRREEIEQRILTDDDFHREVEACENDLLDQYVYGELGPRELRLFQKNFLKSDIRRRKLQFALALRDKLVAEKPAWVRWSVRSYLLAASVLLAAGLGLESVHLMQRLSREQDRVSALNRQLEEQRHLANTQSGWSTQDAVLVAKLGPAGVRGGEMAEITVPNGVRGVQFVLDVQPALQGKMQVRLLDDAGYVITTASGIQPQDVGGKQVLIVTFSAQYFPSANYFIEVMGEGAGSAHFRYGLKVVDRKHPDSK